MDIKEPSRKAGFCDIRNTSTMRKRAVAIRRAVVAT
jgi:hypothetical protein